MLLKHIRYGERIGIDMNFWSGAYSFMRVAGSIETFVFRFLQGSKESVSLVVPISDGIGDWTQAQPMIESVPRPILSVLATRFDIQPHPILLLPLDDDIFSRGLLPVLSNIPRPPWEKRIPKVFWRGMCSGGYPSVRSRTVEKLIHSEHNVRLIHHLDCMHIPIIPEHYGPKCGLDEHFRYKYILILDGTHIASNHMWVFGSGAVPIMITHPDNDYWFRRFIVPMVHYVPIEYHDLSDLEKKIKWLQEHDFEAKNIMNNAMHLAETVFSAEFQQQYLRDEMQRIVQQHYDRKIPRKIFQTWWTKDLSPEFQGLCDTWKEKNPGYTYTLMDDEDCLTFLRQHFKENVVQAYDRIIPGAFKADLWRCCVLYIHGGIYADMDTMCLHSFENIVEKDAEFVAPIDLNNCPAIGNHNVFNAFIASVPRHPILWNVISRIVDNVEKNRVPFSNLDFSGPGVLGRAVNEYLSLSEESSMVGKQGMYDQGKLVLLSFEYGTEYVKDSKGTILFQNKNGNSTIQNIYAKEVQHFPNHVDWGQCAQPLRPLPEEQA
jgi:mannosyltransferase OCH1-like enzyme